MRSLISALIVTLTTTASANAVILNPLNVNGYEGDYCTLGSRDYDSCVKARQNQLDRIKEGYNEQAIRSSEPASGTVKSMNTNTDTGVSGATISGTTANPAQR